MIHTVTRAVSIIGVVGVLASCGGGGSSSNPPAITAQPQTQSVVAGNSVALAVSATGNNLTYQWNKNGVAIPGATASTYTVSTAALLENGVSYTATVTNGDGSVTSSPAVVTLTLSSNQQLFEQLILSAGGSHSISWKLLASGSQVSGTNYLYSTVGTLTRSPLNGPQLQVQSAAVNLTTSLPLVTRTPTWTLKDGTILTTPGEGYASLISYVGKDIKLDYLAADQKTVAYSELRTNYSAVPLSGLLSATPAELVASYYSLFQNPQVLNTTMSYAANSAYTQFTAVNQGNRYKVFDCFANTTTTLPLPCYTNTTLDNVMAAQPHSNSDNMTYTLADGTIATIGGVRVWMATAARPVSSTLTSTVEYRVYFELGGNVYTGSLVRDGAVVGNTGYLNTSNVLTTVPYQIRLNKAARDSIAAASTL